jgi:hypothetical protein
VPEHELAKAKNVGNKWPVRVGRGLTRTGGPVRPLHQLAENVLDLLSSSTKDKSSCANSAGFQAGKNLRHSCTPLPVTVAAPAPYLVPSLAMGSDALTS